jgi:hypothetical protein
MLIVQAAICQRVNQQGKRFFWRAACQVIGYKPATTPIFVASTQALAICGTAQILWHKAATMNNDAKLQTADQTLKGAVIALVTYIGYRRGWDMQLIALAIPVVSGVMAYLSTLIGNKNTACLFVSKDKQPE